MIAGQRDYTAVEFDAELPELRRTLAALGAAGEEELGPDRFLELLRQRARRFQGDGSEPAQDDLAAAIRREIGAAIPAPADQSER